MENFVHKLALHLTAPLKYDDEQRAVVQYGLYAIIQMLAIAIVIILFGLIAGCLWECIIIYSAAGLLRKSTGGAHAKTSNGCLVVSIIAVTIFGAGSRYITLIPYGFYICFVLSPIFFLAACIIIYKLAPVGHPNKPLNSPQKRKKLRRQSLITLVLYATAVFVLLIISFYNTRTLNIAFSLCIATLWQSLTLVKAVIK